MFRFQTEVRTKKEAIFIFTKSVSRLCDTVIAAGWGVARSTGIHVHSRLDAGNLQPSEAE